MTTDREMAPDYETAGVVPETDWLAYAKAQAAAIANLPKGSTVQEARNRGVAIADALAALARPASAKGSPDEGLREAAYRVEVGGDGLLVVGPDGEQWDCSEEDGIEALVAALNARPAAPASDGLREALRSLDDLSADLGRYIEAKKRFDAHSDEFTSDDWRQIDRFDLGVWKGYFDMARAALAAPRDTDAGLREAAEAVAKMSCYPFRHPGYEVCTHGYQPDHCPIEKLRAALRGEQRAEGKANYAEERSRRYMYALENIIVRCAEGDTRTDWLPTIASIARAALGDEHGAAGEGA